MEGVKRPRTAAVIVAAGGSTRMGVPKQLLEIGGLPVIARTLLAFEEARLIDGIVLVAREEEREAFRALAERHGIRKLRAVVPGGDTRQLSAASGAARAGRDADFLAIHDGARPLILPAVIDSVVREAHACGAAAAAVPVKDTLKTADKNGFVTGTPDRRFLWNVQTPQVFRRALYEEALARAQAEGLDFTDDCQLVERLGRPVRLVRADYGNLKITTPEDAAVAEILLRRRETASGIGKKESLCGSDTDTTCTG